MKPEHFSRAIFEHPLTIEYFAGILANSDRQRAYLAKEGDQIVGTISIARLKDFYEIHGFYVALDRQGQGIGKLLMKKALEFCRGDLPVRVEVAENLNQSIAMYQRWGFKPKPQYGLNMRHWPEWPEGLQNGYIYLQAEYKDLKV